MNGNRDQQLKIADNPQQTPKLVIKQTQPRYKSLRLPLILTLSCSLSALYYGYSLTSFNSIKFSDIVRIHGLQQYPRSFMQGLLTGMTCFTGAIGTIISVWLIGRYSRREALLVLSIMSILVCLLLMVPGLMWLLIGRIFQGFIIGCISCIAPLYVKEMMPKQVTGILWSIHQNVFVIGMSSGFILTFVFESLLGMRVQTSWRIIFGFPIITAIFQIILFGYLYKFNTPKQNILAGNIQGARYTIQNIYKQQYVETVLQQFIEANNYARQKEQLRKTKISQIYEAEIEMDIIQVDGIKKQEERQKQIELKRSLLEKKVEPIKLNNNPLALFAAFYLLGQQNLLGQPAVIQYSVEMASNTFPSLQKTIPFIISIAGLFGAAFSIFLTRKYGRKQILMGGICISSVTLMIGFFIFSSMTLGGAQAVQKNSFFLRLILFTDFLIIRINIATAMGPVPWIYIAEIVQPNILPWAFLTNWIAIGFVSFIFPIMCQANDGNPSIAFLIFGVVAIISTVVNKFALVQTKNKTELQIRKEYDQKCK